MKLSCFPYCIISLSPFLTLSHTLGPSLSLSSLSFSHTHNSPSHAWLAAVLLHIAAPDPLPHSLTHAHTQSIAPTHLSCCCSISFSLPHLLVFTHGLLQNSPFSLPRLLAAWSPSHTHLLLCFSPSLVSFSISFSHTFCCQPSLAAAFT
jgi:hypothetical protein